MTQGKWSYTFSDPPGQFPIFGPVPEGSRQHPNVAWTKDEAIAALIVRAVSAHEAIKESLEGLLAIAERQFATLPPAPDSEAWQYAKRRLEKARAALKLAETE